MKKFLFTVLAISLLTTAGIASAKEPKGIKQGNQKIDWNLSGAVMPVPPYGLSDIIGSDTLSKLKVNSNQGSIKGKMKGLTANTTYTVYVSKPYVPYVCAGWNVAGSYTMDLLYLSNHYVYALTLNQSGATISGNLNDPYLPGNLPVNGTINGNAVTFSVNYGSGSVQGVRTFTGTINVSGFLSGSWNETGTEQGSATWSTTSGAAIKNCSGSTGWTGLLTEKIQPFTFTTNADGEGKWKVKINDNDLTKPVDFSVWINGAGGTILISDNARLEITKPKKVK